VYRNVIFRSVAVVTKLDVTVSNAAASRRNISVNRLIDNLTASTWLVVCDR